MLSETLAAQRATLGEDHFESLLTWFNLTKVTYDRGDHEHALDEYRAITARFEAHYPEHFFCAIATTMQGRCLMELGRYTEAEKEFIDAHTRISEAQGPGSRDSVVVASALADLYARWDRAEDEAIWRSIAAGEDRE